jgi:hypothetical protein
MYSITPNHPIASAAAVFLGCHGQVSQLARDRRCSRQTLYRQADAVATLVDSHQPRLLRQRLADTQARLTDVQRHLAQAQDKLRQAIVLDRDRQAEFAVTAQSHGVSLAAARALLAVALRTSTPSVAQLGRFAQAAGRRATAMLAVIDPFSAARARQIAADEIFVGRKPILMTLEQDSMCWLGGRLAKSRDGLEWAQEFRRLPVAEQVTCDRGQGLRKGLDLVNVQRSLVGQDAIADQSDHFHPIRRGQQAMQQVRCQAERVLQQAERLQKVYDEDGRQGRRRSPMQGRALNKAWSAAEQAFDRWTALEQAFGRLRAGLRLFSPLGELNTPERAEAEVTAALAQLEGPGWARVRRGVGPEAFTYLRRVQQQLSALSAEPELIQAAAQLTGLRLRPEELLGNGEPLAVPPAASVVATQPSQPEAGEQLAAQLVGAAVRAEGLRARPEALQGEGEQARVLRGMLLVAGMTLALAGVAGEKALALVRVVLQGSWRASSLVEGLNSVVRMHQGRHKRLTQGLLDLKRLYWNVHEFGAGKRKGSSPYGRLGVVLPQEDWWELLKRTPEQLREQLSALNPAA